MDVIVIGGGHAGIEAALATAKLGKQTLLITGSLERVGFMSCNPSIGGPAKGVVVREIDALGGAMARLADQTKIQIKMLNRSKGPAVWALRAQIDKVAYPKAALKLLQNQENLTLLEALVDGLIIEDDTVKGVILKDGQELYATSVIITTGTYLASKVLRGHTAISSGPDQEPTTYGLSNTLKTLGFNLIRLKTGTPARIKRDSINFDLVTPQYGDPERQTFSFYEVENTSHVEEVCYLTHTNEHTHNIINEHLDESSMYGGLVEGVGPRYCPSIEDKVVRFHDKPRHQVFLEPETLSNDEMYLQGLSTSMPEAVQVDIIRSVKGLENAEIVKYGYAIEYDAIDPRQLKQTLETKAINNLYCAGQINGTSGYEEAACQGLMAGINAALKLDNKTPFILRRDEAYIGILIDDLISKGTEDPYRLLTTRSEFRLMTRHDNADLRLTRYGYQFGLIDEERFKKFLKKETEVNTTLEQINNTYLFPNEQTNQQLEALNTQRIQQKTSVADLLRRPDVTIRMLKNIVLFDDISEEAFNQVEINIKYAKYIEEAYKRAEKMKSIDGKVIPDDIDYDQIHNIAFEARDKLKQHQPKTIGQASRISGVNESDLSVLAIYLEVRKK